VKLPEARKLLGKDLYWRLKKYGIANKHILFVAEYLTNGFHETNAYLVTVARKNAAEGSRASCGVEACRILKQPMISEAVKEMMGVWLDEKKQKLEKEIIEVLYKRAFYDPEKLVKQDGSPAFTDWKDIPQNMRVCVDSIETRAYGKDADRSITVMKLANRENAMRELAKYIQLFKEPDSLPLTLTEDTVKNLMSIFGKK
jgi:hypothetical protein